MKKTTLRGMVIACMALLFLACPEAVLAEQTTVTESFNSWTGAFNSESSVTEGLNTTDFTYTLKQFTDAYVYGKSVTVTDGDNALFLGASFPARAEEDSVPTQVKPYVIMEPARKQDIGENGTAVLEFDFKIDSFFEHSGKVGDINYKSQPFSLSGELYTTEFDFDTVKDGIADFAAARSTDGGKWLGYTDSNSINQNYNSYLEIQSADKVMVFANSHTLKKALTAGEWHHLTLAVNSDNTYTLTIDRETVAYNQPIGTNNFRIRYTYTNTSGAIKNYDTATSGVTAFRGFKSLWVQYYEDPYYTDGEQGYYIDNISVTGSDSGIGLPNYVYNEPFAGYTGWVENGKWTSNADKNNVNMLLIGAADNFPAPAEGVGGKTADYLSLSYTEDYKRAYVNISRKDITGWESGTTGATKLTLDFLLTEEETSAFVGGHLLYYDADGAAQTAKYVAGNITAPFIKISANTAEAMGVAEKTLETPLALNTWHTVTMYLNGDNTFSMYVDEELVYGDEDFDLNSNDNNYTLKDVEVEGFLGFTQIWLQRGGSGDPAEATGAVCYDNVALELYPEYHKLGILKETTVYNEPFDGWNGYTGDKSYSSNADKNNVTMYLAGADNYPALSAEGVDGRTTDYLSIIYTETGRANAYVSMSRKDKTGWANSAAGATRLSVDFALSDLNTSAFIGGYVLYYDEEGAAQELKYRNSKGATGAFIEINGTTASAWGNATNLQTPLEANKWYTATLYMNGDFTYSLYIDDMPVFQNKAVDFTTFGDFYYKATSGTVTPQNFLGFTQVWVQRGAGADTTDEAVYYDNVQLVTANQYYRADTSAQDVIWAQEAANSLKIYTTHVENGLALDSIVAMNGAESVATVSWESSNPEVITNYGVVYPTVGQEQTVTMTATVTYQMASVTKTFDITVPAVDAYTITGVKITGEDGIVDTALVGGKTVSKVSVKRYTDSDAAICVITALYKDGILQDVTVNEAAPGIAQYNNGDIELTKPITLPENIDGYTLKVMLWDDEINLEPLAEALTVEAQSSQVTIYTAGDSTVQTYGANYKPQEGWGQNLAGFLTEAASVDNSQAMGGRTSKSFIAENRLQTILNRIQPGDYLLVQFGHNDAKTDTQKSSLDGTYISRGTSIDEYNSYARYLEIYVDAARDKGANVILITSVNRESDRTGANLQGYPEAMRDFAAKKNVPLLDLTAASIALQKELENTENHDYIDPRNLYMFWNAGDTRFDFTDSTQYSNAAKHSDSTHFNSYGAKCIAQLIAQELKEMGSPLSRFVDETTYFDVIENMPTPLYTR